MPSIPIRIRKISDRELIDRVKKAIASCGFSKIHYQISIANCNIRDNTDANWFNHQQLKDAIDLDSTLINSLNVYFKENVYFLYSRDQSTPLYDGASVNTSDNSTIDTKKAFPIIKEVLEIFEGVSSPVWNLDALGSDVKSHYQAREQYLERQEREVSSFFSKMADYTRQQTVEHRTKMDELEIDFTNRQNKLEQLHQL